MMNYPQRCLTIVLLLKLFLIDGYIPPRFNHRSISSSVQRRPFTVSSTSIGVVSKDMLGDKEFQLEEREDKDSELTEIWLNGDGTVTLGDTDGPPVKSYEGKWSIIEFDGVDKPFRLRLERTYEAGTHTGKSDMGEFQYTVKREFWGNIGAIGDLAEIEGVVHGLDEAANVDCEVGFFSMIDASSDGVKVEK